MQTIELIETSSTNDDARKLAEAGADHLTVVWAHRQTAGRGRRERGWVSNDGNIFCSIILRPRPGWPLIHEIPFVNALAVGAAISSCITSHSDVCFKWPNDIIMHDRKVSGSLIEAAGAFANGQPDWIIIGTGINLASHPVGDNLQYPPSSLHALGYKSVTRESLILSLGQSTEREIEFWLANGFSAVRKRYLDRAHRLNEEISVGLSADKADYIGGVYEGIDDRGYLLLKLSTGERRRFLAGDLIAKI
jgi:BirA family biotin operon repressor/biotin-[acetyl-CoA-carboxylase] ligase